MRAYALSVRQKNESLKTNMADLLCDLMHLAKKSKLSFFEVLSRAYGHFDEETTT